MSANTNKQAVIALGFFDGVHKGHAQLIDMAKKRAKEKNVEPAVLSFDVSPESIVAGHNVPLIGTVETREYIIRHYYNVDNVIIYHFDKTFMSTPWKEFINTLVSENNAVHLVIGHDFHCGYMGKGNPQKIEAYCKEIGIGCDIIPKFTMEHITVSSTYIRSLLEEGNMERAEKFLGHPYIFSGTVTDGHKVGRKMGNPTINLKFDDKLLLPPKGVYATRAILSNGEVKTAITNIGVRPTFSNEEKLSVETYIFDYEGNLYGQFVVVEFYKYLRSEKRFDSSELLRKQIETDIIKTKEFFEKKNK